MINTLLRNILPGNPRQVIDWRRMIFNMETRIEYYRTSRFLLAPVVQSPLVNLLKFLLLNIDINYLLKEDSDFDRYSKHIVFEIDNLRSAFDPVWTGKLSKRIFLPNTPGKPAPEVIVNSTYANPLMQLPLDKPWEDWEEVSPVRLLHYDSFELASNLFRFSLKFKTDKPTYLVASIDIVALILKYINYIKFMEEDQDVEHYIHHHVINHLYRDISRIWILNHMVHTVQTITGQEESFKYKKYMSGASPLIINSAFDPAMRNFAKEYLLLKNLNIRLGDFVSTYWFNGYSIRDLMEAMTTKVNFPTNRQYAFAKMLKELPLIKLIVTANSQRPTNHPEVRQINLLLRRIVERYQREKVWKMIRSPVITPLLETEVNSLYELMVK